jgi:transposase
MFLDYDAYEYYVRPGVTDMRKGTETLLSLVTEEMSLDPFAKSMFLFCSRGRNRLKVLVWDDGFWLMQKRLPKGTLAWPRDGGEARMLTSADVRRLLAGEDIFRRIPSLEKHYIM